MDEKKAAEWIGKRQFHSLFGHPTEVKVRKALAILALKSGNNIDQLVEVYDALNTTWAGKKRIDLEKLKETEAKNNREFFDRAIVELQKHNIQVAIDGEYVKDGRKVCGYKAVSGGKACDGIVDYFAYMAARIVNQNSDIGQTGWDLKIFERALDAEKQITEIHGLHCNKCQKGHTVTIRF